MIHLLFALKLSLALSCARPRGRAVGAVPAGVHGKAARRERGATVRPNSVKMLKHLLQFALTVPALIWSGTATAQELKGSEYAIKAAYLYNFALFAEWPATNATTPTDPVIFCIAGKDPFSADIMEEFRTRKVHDRDIEIRYITARQDPRSCQVLFINEPEERRIAQILRQVQGVPVLTVGEHKEFIDKGGMIGFVIVADHVQFEVNQGAVENADLKLSSRMLQLAYRVKPPGDRP